MIILSLLLSFTLLGTILRYTWLQCIHVILTAFMLECPTLTLAVIPGTISLLHFLQNSCLISYGSLTLYLILIFFISLACISASSRLYFAVSTTFLNSISILCLAISFFNLFNLLPLITMLWVSYL